MLPSVVPWRWNLFSEWPSNSGSRAHWLTTRCTCKVYDHRRCGDMTSHELSTLACQNGRWCFVSIMLWKGSLPYDIGTGCLATCSSREEGVSLVSFVSNRAAAVCQRTSLNSRFPWLQLDHSGVDLRCGVSCLLLSLRRRPSRLVSTSYTYQDDAPLLLPSPVPTCSGTVKFYETHIGDWPELALVAEHVDRNVSTYRYPEVGFVLQMRPSPNSRV